MLQRARKMGVKVVAGTDFSYSRYSSSATVASHRMPSRSSAIRPRLPCHPYRGGGSGSSRNGHDAVAVPRHSRSSGTV
jgi:hypothetical protein